MTDLTRKEHNKKRKISFDFNPHILVFTLLNIMLVSILYKKTDTIISTFDGPFHIYRMMGAVGALSDGQIVPQLDPYRIKAFGNAANIFYGPMTSWLMVPIYFITRNLQWSIIILMFVISMLTSISMYKVSSKILSSANIAFIVTLIYTLEPFHLSEMIMRLNPGEYMTFAFIPLVILAFYEIVYQNKLGFRQILLLSGGMAGLILNHILTSVIVAFAFLLMTLFNLKRIIKHPKILGVALISAIIAIGLSAVYLFPFLEAKNVGIYSIFWNKYKMSNPDINEFSRIIPAIAFLTNFAFPIRVSWVVWAGVFGFILMKDTIKDSNRKYYAYSLIAASLITVFLGMNFKFLDGLVPYIKTLQFTDRLLMIPAVFLPLVCGLVFLYTSNTKEKYILVVMLLLPIYGIITSMLAQPRIDSEPFKTVEDFNYDDINFSIAQGEYFPKMISNRGDISVQEGVNSTQENLVARGDKPKTVSGHASISDYQKTGSHITGNVQSGATKSAIEFPLVYYPGYVAEINGQKVKTTYSKKGFLEVEIPANTKGQLRTKYGMTNATKLGLTVTIITSVSLIVLSVKDKRKEGRYVKD